MQSLVYNIWGRRSLEPVPKHLLLPSWGFVAARIKCVAFEMTIESFLEILKLFSLNRFSAIWIAAVSEKIPWQFKNLQLVPIEEKLKCQFTWWSIVSTRFISLELQLSRSDFCSLKSSRSRYHFHKILNCKRTLQRWYHRCQNCKSSERSTELINLSSPFSIRP